MARNVGNLDRRLRAEAVVGLGVCAVVAPVDGWIREVGCARAQCTRNSPFPVSTWYLWVCNYALPGNFVGERPY